MISDPAPLPGMEFWFEFGSNYSYLSLMRIEDEARRRGVKLIWRPFLLGAIFKALGFETSPFVLQKEKGAHVWRDMERQCRKYGLEWRKPSRFPRLGVVPLRIALVGTDEPQFRHAFPDCRKDRPDESIAATGQGFDPAFAAGGLAKHPAQRRDLSRKVAFLDRPAGPRGFEKRVLRNQCAGSFNQGLQQGDRPPAERHRRAVAEQQMGLGVQAKRSQRMDSHHDSF